MCTRYFTALLKEELRDNIRGGYIDIHTVNGMLIVDINTIYDLVFRYTDSNIMYEILAGKTAKEKAFEISKKYEKYLLSHYFTKKYLK